MEWDNTDIYSIEQLNFDHSFSLAKYTSNLSLIGQSNNANKIIIHILEIWDKVDNATYSIWEDLIESAGFYPYLNKIHNLDSTSEIRKAYHSSKYLEGVTFHREQKQLSDLIERKQNLVVSAPTSFGKSLLIQEIIASQKYTNVLIIQPTLALINETRLKVKKYSEYNTVVNTSQKMEEKNIFILTAERVLEYPDFPHIDYCILDEFYKVSSSRDDERSDVLNIALKKVLSNDETLFCFLGPNIDEISLGFEEKYNAKFIRTDYSLVDTKIKEVDINYTSTKPKTMENERKERLFELLSQKKNEQSIVYLSSPDRALKISKEYYEYLKNKDLLFENQFLPINEWIEQNISINWSFNRLIEQKIGVHSGIIPKHLTHSIIDYFNRGTLNILFCTSTIIEGVNTSAKNVFIFDDKKGPNKIDYFDFSNIRGRAGRLLEHYTGNVFIFHPIPQIQKIELDIPFYDQEKISDEVLINFEKNEIKEINISRFEELTNYEGRLLEIIKNNAVSVDGQKHLVSILRQTLVNQPELVLWQGKPTFKALSYILNICWDNLMKPTESKLPMTRNKLPVVTYNNLHGKSTKELLISEAKYLKSQKPKWTNQRIVDQAISNYFREHRHWISYKVPKWLNVINVLQKEVCRQEGFQISGDYTFVASQLENEGVNGDLSILLDMGLPSSVISKLKDIVSEGLNSRQIISEVKKIADSNIVQLLEYEKDKIKEL